MQFYDEGLDQEELKNQYLIANSRCTFKNSNELILRIEEYFNNCYKQKKAYTISGLALYLGVTTETLRRWEKDYGSTDYAEIITWAKQRVEEFAEEKLYEKGASGGAKFVLQNNFGWANKEEVTQNVNVKLEDVL